MRAIPSILFPFLLVACGGDADDHGHEHGPDTHTHDDDGNEEADDHEHGEEVDLGTATVGELEVELAQGGGPLVAGEEAHLVVKLPYSDEGSTVVRAWIGTEDRTRSYVGKGEHAPSHDDYDVHATAPDPLPEDARWWIEIERPDGTRELGSAEPLRE